MKVIGVDPGTAACGYGIVHDENGRLEAIDHGWWKTSSAERLELRLKTIFDGVAALIELHAPDAVALEELYFGANARSAMAVGQARGVVMLAAGQRGIACSGYTPQQIKGAVCGHGRADKDQVQRMVGALLGLPEPPRPDHAADALAVAICHAARMAGAPSARDAIADGARL